MLFHVELMVKWLKKLYLVHPKYEHNLFRESFSFTIDSNDIEIKSKDATNVKTSFLEAICI